MTTSFTGTEPVPNSFIATLKYFPPIDDGKINTEDFLAASSDLVSIVERFGKLFSPVKYDMQGNIDKIRKYHETDKNRNSCILEMMRIESQSHQLAATEGVLWLNRALLFFEIVFQQIVTHLQEKRRDICLKLIFSVAYEGSVKQYHNWVSRQVFNFICKMSPTFLQLLKALEVNDIDIFQEELLQLYMSLHLVRSKIDNFFEENNLFCNK